MSNARIEYYKLPPSLRAFGQDHDERPDRGTIYGPSAAVPMDYPDMEWHETVEREIAPVTLPPFPWADKPLPPEDE